MKSPAILKLLVLILCGIGFLDTLILTGVQSMGAGLCGAAGQCDKVLTSDYATIAGIKLSVIGTVFYSFLTVNALLYTVGGQKVGLYLLLGAALIGSLCSLAFIGLQAWVIRAWCPLCLISAGTQFILLLLCIFLMRLESTPLKQVLSSASKGSVTGYYAIGALSLTALLWSQPILFERLTAWKESHALVASFAQNKTYLRDIRDPKLCMYLYQIEKARHQALKIWYEETLLLPRAKAAGYLTIDDWLVKQIEAKYGLITRPDVEKFYRDHYQGKAPMEEVVTKIANNIMNERYTVVRSNLIQEAETHQQAKFILSEPTLPIVDMEIDPSTIPVLGNPNAPIKIVEFSDFQCHFCRDTFWLVKSWQERYPDIVCVVFRHHPLDNHEQALLAARASIAAFKQGKFWEYAEKLYSKQSFLGEATYLAIANELGLSIESFDRDRKSAATDHILEREKRDSALYNISRVPTIFINGQLIDTRTHLNDDLIEKYVGN